MKRGVPGYEKSDQPGPGEGYAGQKITGLVKPAAYWGQLQLK